MINNLSSINLISIIGPIFADLPIFFLPVYLISAWLYYTFFNTWNDNNREKLMFIFYSCVVAILISLIIQQFVSIDRPETAITESWKLLLKHIPDASFPSDHASVSVAFLVWLFFAGQKKIFWAFFPWVILMNIARIVVWVHWPFDIIVWSCVWAFWAYVSFFWLTQIKFVKKLNSFIILLLSYIKL